MGACVPIGAVQNLKKYALIEKLGEGYLGSVYRGFDQDLSRAVVIRILCEGIKWNAKVEERFHRECGSAASLQHPNIAAIFDVGKEDPYHYIVMESLGGKDLESLIRQKSVISAEAKLSIMIQVAEGLGHAHKNGVLHRDLSPRKIHLAADGSVKIRDFAITHVLMKHLPHPAVRWGAPIYMSPEQIEHKAGDKRSDVFSAGMVFYELLTCLHPFHDPNGNKALDNILLDTQVPTFEQFPDAPPGIWPILKTCLARDPNDRYQSMDELSDALRELLKSLAEDKQLMLAELYASLAPLRKAAARPNASKGIRRLLRDVERLSRGDIEADYTSLDRLMTVLIEHYPIIQAAASAPDPVTLHLHPEKIEAASAAEISPIPPEEPIAATAGSPQEQRSTGTHSSKNPDLEAEPPGKPEMAPAGSATAEDKTEHHGSGFAGIGDLRPELRQSPMISGVSQALMPPATIGSNDGAALQLQPPIQDSSFMGDLSLRAASLSRDRRIPKPTYRSAAALLSLLVIAAAAYIVLGTEEREYVRNAWSIFLTKSNSGVSESASQPGTDHAGSGAATGTKANVRKIPNRDSISALLQEAHALAAENRFAESLVLIRGILEANPTNEAAKAALREVEEKAAAGDRRITGNRTL